MCEALDVVQYDDDALTVGQSAERPLEIDRRRRPRVARRREVVEQIGLDIRGPTEPRVGSADADRREPRRELRLAGVPMKAATRGEPRLLHHVVDRVLPRRTE